MLDGDDSAPLHNVGRFFLPLILYLRQLYDADHAVGHRDDGIPDPVPTDVRAQVQQILAGPAIANSQSVATVWLVAKRAATSATDRAGDLFEEALNGRHEFSRDRIVEDVRPGFVGGDVRPSD
jgi:hypothetical protein